MNNDNLIRLIDNASFLLESKPPDGVSEDEFRDCYLASLKLSKLEDAQEKSSDAINDLLSIVSSYSKTSAMNKIKSLEIIDNILFHDFCTYQKVINILQNKES